MRNMFPNNSISRKSSFKILFIVAIILVALLAGALSFYLIGKEKSTISRTVMIYMVGSDLESEIGMASSDLKKLNYKKTKNNNTNVILMAGGSLSWQNDYIDVNETSIYTLGKNGFEKIDIRAREDMGTSENLLYFLNYVYQFYQTDKYDFIYWNHGGAIDGSEYDAFTDDHLMLEDMRKAFDNSPFKGENKLEVMSFRTCLNGTVEIANLYKEYANYFIASEEIAYVTNTVSSLRFLNEIKPTDTGVEFGKKQIDNYKRLIKEICDESMEEYCVDVTYSIIDLSKMDTLNTALDVFSSDLMNHLSSNYSNYSKIRSNMNQYGVDIKEFDMVDLYDLTNQFNEYSEKGEDLREQIENAVIYNWSSNDYSHGLSIYFPYHKKIYLSFYNSIANSPNYAKFIENFYNTKSSTKVTSYNEISKVGAMIGNIQQEEEEVELTLTDEEINNLAKVSYLVFADTKDGYYEIVYQGKDVKIENNKIKANVKRNLLRLSDFEYDDNSIWLSAKEAEVGEDYTDLKTAVVLSKTMSIFQNRNVIANLTIRIDKKHPNGYIKSIYTTLENVSDGKRIDTSTYSPVGISLTDYNFISILSTRYKLLDESGIYNPNWKEESNDIIRGETFRSNEIKFVKEKFSDEYDYYVVFQMFDITNNEYNSLPIKIN